MTANSSNGRRTFLHKLMTAVTGTAAIAATSSVVQASPVTVVAEPETKPDSKSKGYQRSQHVDTYYQLADF